MAAPQPQPPSRGGMSLYADLLGGSSDVPLPTEATATPTKTSPAPTTAKNPALLFQPIIRRPQQKAKAKPKTMMPGTFVSSTPAIATTTTTAPLKNTASSAPPPHARSTLADWTGNREGGGGGGGGGSGDDDDGFYHDGTAGPDNASRRYQQRGGRRNKKKRRPEDRPVDWNELYDPSRPTNMEAYLHSDERIQAIREWKGVLYAHRRRRQQEEQRQDDTKDSSDSDAEPPPRFNNAFAPPPALAFMPPPPTLLTTAETTTATAMEAETKKAMAWPRTDKPEAQETHTEKEDPEGDTPMNDDEDDDSNDAYSPPLDIVSSGAADTAGRTSSPPPPPLLSDVAPTLADGLIVSRAPVRFQPAAINTAGETDYDYGPPASSETAAPRSNRPGQAGFAARLMAKYGWTKGSGLGADESGIVNPLRHKRLKRGGGAAEAAASGPIIGRIVGGDRPKGSSSNSNNKSKNGQEGTTPASPSQVIVLRNMVDGLPDLEAELADGQLVQEIGEECGAQYGRIERVYIDVVTRLVFIKFTEQVSALRAVNALQGRIFNGNAIEPSFYDLDMFEQGIYR